MPRRSAWAASAPAVSAHPAPGRPRPAPAPPRARSSPAAAAHWPARTTPSGSMPASRMTSVRPLADHDDAAGQLRHGVALERQHGALDRGRTAAGKLRRGTGLGRHRGVAVDLDAHALDADVHALDVDGAGGLHHDARRTGHQLDLGARAELELLPDGGRAVAGDVKLVVLAHGGRALARDVLGLVVLDGHLLVVVHRHDTVVLHLHMHVLLRMHEEVFAALLVLEAKLVEILRAAALVAAALDAALGHVVGQRVRRHVVGVVDAADYQRPVRIAFEEAHHHFLADARNAHRAPVLAGPRGGHAHRTGDVEVFLVRLVPVERDLDAAILVHRDVFGGVAAGDHRGLQADDAGLDRGRHAAKRLATLDRREMAEELVAALRAGDLGGILDVHGGADHEVFLVQLRARELGDRKSV